MIISLSASLVFSPSTHVTSFVSISLNDAILEESIYVSKNDEEGYSYSKKEALKILKDSQYTLDYYINDEDKSINGVKVVGVLNADGKADKYSDLYVLPDSLYNLKWTEGKGEYSYAVATMPTNKADIEKLVKYCYTEQGNMKYQIENSVTFELDTVNEVLKVMSKVFLYIGIGFAVFAMIMLSNFIATSISYKKQEIGILRAIGARSNDVFSTPTTLTPLIDLSSSLI